jgi:hypothetical protein
MVVKTLSVSHDHFLEQPGKTAIADCQVRPIEAFFVDLVPNARSIDRLDITDNRLSGYRNFQQGFEMNAFFFQMVGRFAEIPVSSGNGFCLWRWVVEINALVALVNILDGKTIERALREIVDSLIQILDERMSAVLLRELDVQPSLAD